MSRFFPHSEYSEDQPYSKTILYTHVIHRGFATGSLLGALTGVARSAFGRSSPSMMAAVTRGSGVGGLVGAGVLGVAGTAVRMYGREEIEWKDRSWRILANKGQVVVDDWSIGGTVAGTALALVRESGRAAGGKFVRIVGGAGLGNLAGVAGYMAYRYGMGAGDFD